MKCKVWVRKKKEEHDEGNKVGKVQEQKKGRMSNLPQ
jgi:hypothetical protein